MTIITLSKFGWNTAAVLSRLARGARFVLSHSGKPSVRLEPRAITPSPNVKWQSESINRPGSLASSLPGVLAYER
jgi:hypothetical protein